MYSFLLAIIYISFISLGLPDSLLGSAWPIMHIELGVPLSFAGIISAIITCSTIISSLLSDRVTRRFGTGLVTAISVALTAAALLGFSLSKSFWILCLFAIPYGLGAGAVDAALNNYVALHYSAKHMSWLHCFWGVGITVSPYVMGYCLGAGMPWNNGYGIISLVQIILSLALFATLPVWKRKPVVSAEKDNGDSKPLGIIGALKLRGASCVLISFFAYCALETTAGLWASSYLALGMGVKEEIAAIFGSLFFLGMTLGRFVCGFVSEGLGDKRLIRIGSVTVICGIAIMVLGHFNTVFALAALVIIGVGAAPIYPAIIHSTPENFGRDNSQAIIGIQMAAAYTGSALAGPLFGVIANNINILLFPAFLGVLMVLAFVMSERLNSIMKNK